MGLTAPTTRELVWEARGLGVTLDVAENDLGQRSAIDRRTIPVTV